MQQTIFKKLVAQKNRSPIKYKLKYKIDKQLEIFQFSERLSSFPLTSLLLCTDKCY
jgi:hypothetical protein